MRIEADMEPDLTLKELMDANLVDEDWYLTQYEEVGVLGLDSVSHFFKYGYRLGYQPKADLNFKDYLNSNIDVKIANRDPLKHYIRHGQFEGRKFESEYVNWIRLMEPKALDKEILRDCFEIASNDGPLISVLMPTYNTDPRLLKEAIDSVTSQSYENWELCIADDNSTNSAVHEILLDYLAKEPRIKVKFRSQNGHISEASNTALSMVDGSWVALLDHDDKLSAHALYYVAKEIVTKPTIQMIYSDEDKIDLDGIRHDPYHKDDWNYRLFLSQNMFSHLGVYKTTLIKSVGGFRVGYEGAQDYDLALRCLERCGSDGLAHIPRVLYHWRVMAGSTALSADEKPYAMIAGERALTDHLQRVNVPGKARLIGFGYELSFNKMESKPSCSIIIPTKDRVDLLKKCLNSIFEKTEYSNLEIIVIDHNSTCLETLKYLSELTASNGHIRTYPFHGEFNFSRMNNEAANLSTSDIIVFMNNDIEIVSENWLDILVANALLADVGAVGVKLLYPDLTIQHVGLSLCSEHIAVNTHKGQSHLSHGYFGRASLAHEAAAVTAACLATKRSIFEKAGGFDEENLPVAYNDVDLCLKFRDLGLRNIVLPEVVMKHHESASRGSDESPQKRQRLRFEQAYMRERWASVLNRDPYRNPVFDPCLQELTRLVV